MERGLFDPGAAPVFMRFLDLSRALFERFGRNWGIPKAELARALDDL
ncbi:MAG: hypothetical protein FWE09_00735 [Treponema sp.]|nr:hypothetical protein [Treponema sp.]